MSVLYNVDQKVIKKIGIDNIKILTPNFAFV